MADHARKEELIAALDRARSRIAVNVHALRDELDVTLRVQRSIKRNRLAWLGGAGLFGLLLAKLPARTKKVFVDREGRKAGAAPSTFAISMLLGVAKITFNMAKPMLAAWLGDRFGGASVSSDRRRN